MKYISIDIETSGLDPINHNILSMAAIVEDTNNQLPFDQIPKFHVGILTDEIVGTPYAINMNRDLIEIISRYTNSKNWFERDQIEKSSGMEFVRVFDLASKFFHFLYQSGYSDHRPTDGPLTIRVAGKNFGTFDKLFLEQSREWNRYFRVGQRIIDPSILFVDWRLDEQLPSLLECKKRAGIPGTVTHNALEDAWDVIQILRTTYQK